MKGKGPKHERETIINFNEDEDGASIWTASDAVYRQLKKRGYVPVEDNERSAIFKMPKGHAKLPRPPSQARIALAKGLAAEKRRSTVLESNGTRLNKGDG